MVKVSIIIPVTREDYLKNCLVSLDNQSFKDFEIILINNKKSEKIRKNIKAIITKNLNPAYRRNLAAKNTKGEIFAFIDDDVYVNKDWIKKAVDFLEKNKSFCVVGGPDILSKNAKFREKISDALLSNKYFGSGVLAHQNYKKNKEINDPSSLALCNLFVRKKAFKKVNGFNEKIGYGGEDTEFLYLLKKKLKCRMMYLPSLFVYHKKRDFMLPYLKQRLKFRINNGKMLFAYPKLYMKNYKFILFFIAATLFFISLFLKPLVAFYFFVLYLILLILISFPYLTKDVRYIILPFAFGMQHLTYYIGILIGLFNFINYNKLRKIRRF